MLKTQTNVLTSHRYSLYARANEVGYPIDMIIDNDPPIERHISVPRDMSQLSCSSFTAGIVEAVLDGLCFVRLHVFCYLLYLYTNAAVSLRE